MSKTLFNLQEIIFAINKIKTYSLPFQNGDDFYHDQKSFDATMMQFVVIGEIISRLDAEFKDSHSTIPWQKIKDFRNIIAHDYFGIDADEIWDIIQNKIIPLQAKIEQILNEFQ